MLGMPPDEMRRAELQLSVCLSRCQYVYATIETMLVVVTMPLTFCSSLLDDAIHTMHRREGGRGRVLMNEGDDKMDEMMNQKQAPAYNSI